MLVVSEQLNAKGQSKKLTRAVLKLSGYSVFIRTQFYKMSLGKLLNIKWSILFNQIMSNDVLFL